MDRMQVYTASQLLLQSSSAVFDEIVEVLCDSFSDDPPTKWLFANRERSALLIALVPYFRCVLHATLLADATIMVVTEDSTASPAATPSRHGRIQALAILIPPHGNAILSATTTFLRAGILRLLLRGELTLVWRLAAQIVPGMESMHARVYPDPVQREHRWSLMFLAARSETQGQGLGTKILRELQRLTTEAAAKATADGYGEGQRLVGGKPKVAPLTLEASSPRSKRLYERVGFVTRGSLVYGKLDDKANDLVIGKDGAVVGGQMYAMDWWPS